MSHPYCLCGLLGPSTQGFPKVRGSFWSLHQKDHSILGSISGPLIFDKSHIGTIVRACFSPYIGCCHFGIPEKLAVAITAPPPKVPRLSVTGMGAKRMQ